MNIIADFQSAGTIDYTIMADVTLISYDKGVFTNTDYGSISLNDNIFSEFCIRNINIASQFHSRRETDITL